MGKKAFICPNCEKTVFLTPFGLAVSHFRYLPICPKCNVRLAFPFYVVLTGTIILLTVLVAGLALTNYAFPFFFDNDSAIGELQIALVGMPSVFLGLYASSIFYKYVDTIVVRNPRPWES